MAANTVDIDFGSLQLDDTNNIAIANIDIKENTDIKTHNIPKSNGSIAETAKLESLTITVTGDVGGSDYDDLRTNIDTLKAGILDGKQKFTIDDDRYITAQIKSFSYKYEWIRTLATWKAVFVAHYPYWLAESATSDDRTPTSGVGYTLTNDGNAPARVKIEITAPAGGISDDIAVSNSTNGQGFTWTGDLAATKVLEVDNRYDTEDFEVLNDGDDEHEYYEGDFMELAPGDNTIVFTGTADTQVKITWRDTYQ